MNYFQLSLVRVCLREDGFQLLASLNFLGFVRLFVRLGFVSFQIFIVASVVCLSFFLPSFVQQNFQFVSSVISFDFFLEFLYFSLQKSQFFGQNLSKI